MEEGRDQRLGRSRASFLRHTSYGTAILCLCGVNPCEGQRWERQKGTQSEDPVGRMHPKKDTRRHCTESVREKGNKLEVNDTGTRSP